uniref:hypothetical protein n=1 Tax=uncultured Altererythrobacter sp. TaxID=500840 RepID=UPI0026068398|nr:hypothetical protein [uncultured Altererythrobacter sp.]
MSSANSAQLHVSAKGRPLLMLAILLSVWVGSRIAAWETPFPMIETIGEGATQLLAGQTEASQNIQAAAGGITGEASGMSFEPESVERYDQPVLLLPSPSAPLAWEEQAATELSEDLATATGHQLIWMAAMAHLPVPQAIEQRLTKLGDPAPPAGALPKKTDRWSLDAWAFWRDGGNVSLVSAARAPTYGASQAGAVLNFRLAPENRRDPRAYARIYRALIDQGETEISAGISARPLAALPLRAHTELRVTEFQTSTEIRPAAFVTTELPVLQLPLGMRAEGYGQAGYVGGKEATAFADGQVHLMRDLRRFDLGALSIGAAAWAGAQEGAERLDVGPSMRVDLTIAQTPARFSLDYRERVAGDAEPPSGVAVTLSTRF